MGKSRVRIFDAMDTSQVAWCTLFAFHVAMTSTRVVLELCRFTSKHVFDADRVHVYTLCMCCEQCLYLCGVHTAESSPGMYSHVSECSRESSLKNHSLVRETRRAPGLCLQQSMLKYYYV